MTSRIGFIGSGQMARALATGFVNAGLVTGDDLSAFDPFADGLNQFTQAVGGHAKLSNQEVVESSDLVFLAVKPQSFSRVVRDLAGVDASHQLFVSILAGVSLQKLCAELGTSRVIRVMPNTPCLIGCGASAFTAGRDASAEDRQFVEKLLQSVGVAIEVKEPLLDVVTGLSGSGPAYVYTMIEALSDGGVRMGLPREQATLLATQTVLGAARMVLETGEHTAVLRDRVASPGGTTIAGIQSLEEHGFRAAVMQAVEAATNRSQELGNS